MTAKLPEIWLKYAFDDLQSTRVLLKEGIYNCIKSAKIYDAKIAEICNCTSEEILEKTGKFHLICWYIVICFLKNRNCGG